MQEKTKENIFLVENLCFSENNILVCKAYYLTLSFFRKKITMLLLQAGDLSTSRLDPRFSQIPLKMKTKCWIIAEAKKGYQPCVQTEQNS